jgi:hypothetical protein
VVEQARALDDCTANTITVNVPQPQTGFGTGRLQGVSRTDLQTQSKRTPAEIRAWWQALTPQQQEQALLEFPDLVGGMDGLPVADRDVANRAVLDRETAVHRQQLDATEARMRYLQSMFEQGRLGEVFPNMPDAKTAMEAETLKLEQVRSEQAGKLRGMDAIAARLNDTGKPQAYLIGFSTADDGRAIVSVGNPDSADNVVTYVPGTGEDLSKAGGGINRADLMAADAAVQAPEEKTSVVYWYGYDAPNSILPDAGYSRWAQDGGPVLDRFQTGLRATHEDDTPSRNTVLGHSYGSTVIGYGARSPDINADALVFVGSPGVDAEHVSELTGVHADQVYATRAAYDAIRKVPDWDIAHGNDPSDLDFGARVFASDPGNPDNEGATHSAYWDRDNIARRNIALIATGGL